MTAKRAERHMTKHLPASERCRVQAEQSVRFFLQVRDFVGQLPIADGLDPKSLHAVVHRARVEACEALLLWNRACGGQSVENSPPPSGIGDVGDEALDWIKTCELPYLGHDPL